jgi:hypothetical protein
LKKLIWLLFVTVILLFLGGFIWYWDILIPTRQVTMSDPAARAYKIDKDHLFIDWDNDVYVVNLKLKGVVRPSMYGHHFLGIWIWPRGLDNYKGVRVGDMVKSGPGGFSFEGNTVVIENPPQHKITLRID